MRRPSSPQPDGGSDDPDAHQPPPVPDDGDPFAPVRASPRFATPLALLAVVLGVVAALGGLSPVAGPVGMASGLIAHVKGSRLGMPATVVAAVGMIIGMTFALYLR